MTEAFALGGVVALVAVVSLWWRAWDGHVRDVADRFADAELAALDAPDGHLLLVLFTAPSCPPCTAARRLLDELADARAAVTVRAVDVGDSVEVARAHRVLRTPTVFVVTPGGAVQGRVSGVPNRDELVELLERSPVRGAA